MKEIKLKTKQDDNGLCGYAAQNQYVELYAYPERDMFGRDIEGGKWGYAERLGGEWVIEPQFDDADDFQEGIGIVEVNGRCGAILPDGSWLIKPKYERLRDFSNGRAAVKFDDGTWGYVKDDGKRLGRRRFVWANDFEDGFAEVKYRGKVRRIDTEGRFDKNETFWDNADD